MLYDFDYSHLNIINNIMIENKPKIIELPKILDQRGNLTFFAVSRSFCLMPFKGIGFMMCRVVSRGGMLLKNRTNLLLQFPVVLM
jgi:hypothetical protein